MIESIKKLREQAKMHMPVDNPGRVLFDYHALMESIDHIEREVAEKYMLKDEAKLEETAVQEYNVTVQVAAGQTIEYNTELRHRCGAATSMSMAFRLE